MTWSNEQYLLVYLEDILIDKQKKLILGTEKLLFNLMAKDINRCLVSNLGIDELDMLVQKLGLRVFFDTIIPCKMLGLDAKDTKFWQQLADKQELDMQTACLLVNDNNIAKAALDAGVKRVYGTQLEAKEDIVKLDNLASFFSEIGLLIPEEVQII